MSETPWAESTVEFYGRFSMQMLESTERGLLHELEHTSEHHYMRPQLLSKLALIRAVIQAKRDKRSLRALVGEDLSKPSERRPTVDEAIRSLDLVELQDTRSDEERDADWHREQAEALARKRALAEYREMLRHKAEAREKLEAERAEREAVWSESEDLAEYFAARGIEPPRKRPRYA